MQQEPDEPKSPQLDAPRSAPLKELVEGVAQGTVDFGEVIEALMPLLRGSAELPTDAALELTTALIEMETASAMDDQLFSLVNTHGAAAIALAPSGQILATNVAAADLFHLTTGDGLASLGITRTAFEQFTRRLSNTPGATLIRGVRAEGAGHRVPIVLSGTYSVGYHAFLLKALQTYWPESVDTALAELFGLTRSEREVLSGLARGRTSDQIAEERMRSVGTIRQQVKSVLHKLEVSTQLEAATMAAAAVATASSAVETAGRTLAHVPQTHREGPLEVGSFLRNRRLVGYRRFGDSEGRPILFIHGPSFGAGEYAEDRRLAAKHQLAVHAVERPGYGRTRPLNRGESVLETQLADLLTYLDFAGLGRVRVLAHEVGLILALELARRRPDLIEGIVAVSAAPPFQALEQIDAMPGHQGIFIQAARQAPWLAHLLTRLLTIRTRRLGVERWTDVIFSGVDPDDRVMRRPALRSGVIGSYSFYLNQLGAGFEQDLQLMLTDWGALITDLKIPMLLLHGRKNLTTPPTYLEIFRELNAHVRIETVEDAGLTLAVSHPHLVYESLSRLSSGDRWPCSKEDRSGR